MKQDRKSVWTAGVSIALAVAMAALAALYATGVIPSGGGAKSDSRTARAEEGRPEPDSTQGPEPEKAGNGVPANIPAMAVVDLENIRKNYRKFNDRDAAITGREKELRKHLDDLRKKADEIKRKRDACREKSEQWYGYDTNLRSALAEMESAVNKADDEIKRLDLKLIEETVGDITDAIERYCKKNGVKIVFWKKEVLLNQPTLGQRLAGLELINVLYADASLDITAPIIQMLNNAYQKN